MKSVSNGLFIKAPLLQHVTLLDQSSGTVRFYRN
jgi:hypothetical protein